jgi:hypothetical protein
MFTNLKSKIKSKLSQPTGTGTGVKAAPSNPSNLRTVCTETEAKAAAARFEIAANKIDMAAIKIDNAAEKIRDIVDKFGHYTLPSAPEGNIIDSGYNTPRTASLSSVESSPVSENLDLNDIVVSNVNEPGFNENFIASNPNGQIYDSNVPASNMNEPVSNADDQVSNANGQVYDTNVQASNMNEPVSDMNMPVSNPNVQVSNMNEPVSDMNMPVSNADGQVYDTNVQASNMNMPVSNPNVEVSNMNEPVSDMNMPVSNANVQATNMNMPVSNTDDQASNMNVTVSNADNQVYDTNVQASNMNEAVSNTDNQVYDTNIQASNMNVPVSNNTDMPASNINVPVSNENIMNYNNPRPPSYPPPMNRRLTREQQIQPTMGNQDNKNRPPIFRSKSGLVSYTQKKPEIKKSASQSSIQVEPFATGANKIDISVPEQGNKMPIFSPPPVPQLETEPSTQMPDTQQNMSSTAESQVAVASINAKQQSKENASMLANQNYEWNKNIKTEPEIQEIANNIKVTMNYYTTKENLPFSFFITNPVDIMSYIDYIKRPDNDFFLFVSKKDNSYVVGKNMKYFVPNELFPGSYPPDKEYKKAVQFISMFGKVDYASISRLEQNYYLLFPIITPSDKDPNEIKFRNALSFVLKNYYNLYDFRITDDNFMTYLYDYILNFMSDANAYISNIFVGFYRIGKQTPNIYTIDEYLKNMKDANPMGKTIPIKNFIALKENIRQKLLEDATMLKQIGRVAKNKFKPKISLNQLDLKYREFKSSISKGGRRTIRRGTRRTGRKETRRTGRNETRRIIKKPEIRIIRKPRNPIRTIRRTNQKIIRKETRRKNNQKIIKKRTKRNIKRILVKGRKITKGRK